MNDFIFPIMAIFGAIFAGLQLYQIKKIADLCERVTRMETEIEHHFNGKHQSNRGGNFEKSSRRFP